jgi:hypothetical protein
MNAQQLLSAAQSVNLRILTKIYIMQCLDYPSILITFNIS